MGENKLKIYCRRKSIFHKHWHTHQLPYSLTRPAPFGQWPVSCLSWVRSEDRMAAASTCSANWTCLSAVAEHRHTLWGYELSVYSGGSPRDWCKLSHRQTCKLSDILTLSAFSVDTFDSLVVTSGTCVCTVLYTYSHLNAYNNVHTQANLFQAIHFADYIPDMWTRKQRLSCLIYLIVSVFLTKKPRQSIHVHQYDCNALDDELDLFQTSVKFPVTGPCN